MIDIIDINSLAIAELLKGNEMIAQSLLRRNVRKSPGWMTFNNLGVYYSQYGMILKTGNIKSAKKLGLRYLLKAATNTTEWRVFASAATALVESGNIVQAYPLFLEAYKNNPDPLQLYNTGTCLFRMNRYEEAISAYQQLENSIDSIIRNGGMHPYLAQAYCYSKIHNNYECMKYTQLFRNTSPSEEYLDVFQLRFLCGRYEEALAESTELLTEWYPTDSVLAMLAECIAHYPSYEVAITNIVISTQPRQWARMKEDNCLRKKTIRALSYLPPFISTYFLV